MPHPRPSLVVRAFLVLGSALAAGCASVAPLPAPAPAPRPAPALARPSTAAAAAPTSAPVPRSRPQLVRAPRADGFVGADLRTSEVRRRIRQASRPGLLFFCTKSCGFCDRMERETLSRPEVAARLATGFVAVRYDVDREPGRQIARAFRPPGYPTLVIVDETGTEIGRVIGFRDAGALLAELAAWP